MGAGRSICGILAVVLLTGSILLMGRMVNPTQAAQQAR